MASGQVTRTDRGCQCNHRHTVDAPPPSPGYAPGGGGEQAALSAEGVVAALEPEEIDVMIDSGASISALPLGVADGYRTTPSSNLTRYRTANGQIMFNRGNKHVLATLPGGVTKTMKFAVMRVNRPIASVSAIVKAGHTVTFGPDGAYITEAQGRKIPLRESNGIYLMKAKVEDPTLAQRQR